MIFFRINFATELSTNLIYTSIFVIDYNYISIHLLFLFTVKLSIFSRLCVKHKRVDEQVNIHWNIKILHWFKKNCAVSDQYRYRQILRIFGIGIGSEKVVSSQP